MSPTMCYMCSIGSPTTKNFRLVHCFGLAYLLDLLHNPKCMGLRSLCSPIYRSAKGVVITPFSLRATKQNHAFLEVVPRSRPPKIPIFLPSLPCPHVAYPLPLWSLSYSIRHYAMVLQCKAGAP